MITAFPELLVSLTIQCTVLLLFTNLLVRRTRTSIAADRLWSSCHLTILLMSLAGVLLPHARLFRGESLLHLCYQATRFPVSQSFWTVTFWIWAIVALAMLANMLRSLAQVSIMLRDTARLPFCPKMEASAEGLRQNISTSSSTRMTDELHALDVSIVTTKSCATPFCWQLHHPIIVLPESILVFPDDELCAIVRHELAHLKSRHPLTLFLQRLVEIGFWFHPLVWRASRAAAKQRELSADRRANCSQADVAGFLRSLIRLSGLSLYVPTVVPIGLNLFSSDTSTVQQRVNQLLAIDWKLPQESEAAWRNPETLKGAGMIAFTGMLAAAIWIPLNSQATGRSLFSPWPSGTATLLHEVGIHVRDYELDSHRVLERFHEND